MEEEHGSDVAVAPWVGDIPRLGESEELVWKGLDCEDRKFVFNKGITVRVTQKKDGWVYESDEIELMGYGRTRSEAESSFCYGFLAQWDDLACEDDKNLTRDAVDIKRAFLALVKAER